jgi:hypothetical protein
LGFSPYHKKNIFSGEKLLSFAIKMSGVEPAVDHIRANADKNTLRSTSQRFNKQQKQKCESVHIYPSFLANSDPVMFFCTGIL